MTFPLFLLRSFSLLLAVFLLTENLFLWRISEGSEKIAPRRFFLSFDNKFFADC